MVFRQNLDREMIDFSVARNMKLAWGVLQIYKKIIAINKKSKNSKLPVIDEIHINGGFLFKEKTGSKAGKENVLWIHVRRLRQTRKGMIWNNIYSISNLITPPRNTHTNIR